MIETSDEQPCDIGAKLGAIRAWILRHDDSWLFTISYVGLAVVLSIWISLFWLVAVVAVHFALEWIRHSHFVDRRMQVFLRASWELKLDAALVLFAFALSAYMDVVLGVAGLGGAARLGLQTGARMAGWNRVLRGVLLSLDDAAQLGRAVMSRRTTGQAEAAVGSISDRRSRRRWSVGDHIGVWLAVICAALLVAAPFFTDHSYRSLGMTLLAELHPMPGYMEQGP